MKFYIRIYITTIVDIIRPHCTHKVHWCSLLQRMLHVVLSVCLCLCLCAGHMAVLRKKWLNWSYAILGADTVGPKETCIRWGWDPPMGRGNFGGRLTH